MGATALAGFFFPALTASRLFFSASIRLTTFGGASTCRRDDLLAGDLRVDDLLQPFAVLVLVGRQVERPLEGPDHLLRQLDLLRLHLRRHRVQLLHRVDAADLRGMVQRVHHDPALLRLDGDQVFAAVERELADADLALHAFAHHGKGVRRHRPSGAR